MAGLSNAQVALLAAAQGEFHSDIVLVRAARFLTWLEAQCWVESQDRVEGDEE